MEESGAAVVGRRSRPPPKRFVHSPIPTSLLTDPALSTFISLLPSLYNFEIHKTIHRIRSSAARRIALQLPDGLIMYSLTLSDIIRRFCSSVEDVIVFGDATYGACCVADHAAGALEIDLLVHYGHSCLVPVTNSLVPTLYVFVEIKIDAARIADAIKIAFPARTVRIAVAGTVQFLAAVHAVKGLLAGDGYENVIVPQAKPLSPGEVLGCTAPKIPQTDGVEVLVFVADGRFHLEAFMIANPGIKAFRYDPFLGVLVLEEYDNAGMRNARKAAVMKARGANVWGIVLGTLGRQGSNSVLDWVVKQLEDREIAYTVVMMSEISPQRIALFGNSIDAWVQIACPRLSIDWGEEFEKPVLTTFEFDVAMGNRAGWWEKDGGACAGSNGCINDSCGCDCGKNGDAEQDYPMDYYAQSGGAWNSCYMKKQKAAGEQKRTGKKLPNL